MYILHYSAGLNPATFATLSMRKNEMPQTNPSADRCATLLRERSQPAALDRQTLQRCVGQILPPRREMLRHVSACPGFFRCACAHLKSKSRGPCGGRATCFLEIRGDKKDEFKEV